MRDVADLVVVPSDRHVERLAREGLRAETRQSFQARLIAGLLPGAHLAEEVEAELALGFGLARQGSTPTRMQMDLFSASTPQPDAGIFSSARSAGSGAWTRTIAAVHDALGGIMARGATIDDLERLATRDSGIVARRARGLAEAWRVSDAALSRVGAMDARRTVSVLAEILRSRPPDEVAALVGSSRVRARWLYDWTPADLGLWRILDERLARIGGWARVELPAFERPLEGARDADPLEALTAVVAKGVDGAPESAVIAPVMGDLTGAVPDAIDSRVRLLRSHDALGQARAVARMAADALRAGVPVERVVIAVPTLDESTLRTLQQALEDAGVVTFLSRAPTATDAPLVTAAFAALDVATTLERKHVAALLRSPFTDPSSLVDAPYHEAAEATRRLAVVLERSPTAAGDDPAERLRRTAMAGGADGAVTDRLLEILGGAAAAVTREARIRASRALWTRLGFGTRAGRGGLGAFRSDARPEGAARLERLAIARDARSWDALSRALDEYEAIVERHGAGGEPIDVVVFAHELTTMLDATTSRPAAGRAAAVRVMMLREVAGEELDLLIIVDANEGQFPRGETQDPVVPDAMWTAVAKIARGRVASPTPGERRNLDLTTAAVAAAGARSVVLCCVREDASGAPIAPSFVFDALERAGVPFVVSAPVEASSLDADALRRARIERTREAFFLDPARPKSEIVGAIAPSDSARALLIAESGGGARPLAVTTLERLARCPFMGYAHAVLGARDADVRDEVPDAREEGNVLHEALAAAFTAVAAEWPRRPRSAERVIEKGMEAAATALAALDGASPMRAVVRLRVLDAVRAVMAEALADEEWDFLAAEQPFGMHSRASVREAWPAFELADGDDALRLRGTIDRVDRAHRGAGVRVTDYKRSLSTVRSAASGLGTSAIQVPLYAVVAERNLGAPATGRYLPTQPRDLHVKPSSKAKARMEELIAHTPGSLSSIEARALELVRALRAGRFVPTPTDEAQCTFCSVSGGCRKPRFAMAPADDDEESSS